MNLVRHDSSALLRPGNGGQQTHRYGIVGRSRAVADVIRRIELVSATRSTVLITGETGTGKELVARAVHHRSAQREHAVRQGQLRRDSRDPAGIGALRPRARRVHGCDRHQAGQVLAGPSRLDLSRRDRHHEHELQAKLLRVLQEREIEPLGGERTEGLTFASSPRPTAISAASSTTAGFRTICSTASTSSRSSSRRCATAPRTSRCWWTISSTSTRDDAAGRSRGCRRASSRRFRTTTGLGTCASSRTRSSARWC